MLQAPLHIYPWRDNDSRCTRHSRIKPPSQCESIDRLETYVSAFKLHAWKALDRALQGSAGAAMWQLQSMPTHVKIEEKEKKDCRKGERIWSATNFYKLWLVHALRWLVRGVTNQSDSEVLIAQVFICCEEMSLALDRRSVNINRRRPPPATSGSQPHDLAE